VSKAEQAFGFHSRMGFEEGLRRTIAWYQAQTGLARLPEAVAA
jgi:nucleoside-diphosphate-sugar epimerase